MTNQRSSSESANLADELVKWVEQYATKVCPPGCLPLPAQEREINLFARITVALRGAAQAAPDRGALTKIAAECHRAKWEFNRSEDYKPNAKVARAMILKAFDELHRIGDMALRLRDAAPQLDGPAYAARQTDREYDPDVAPCDDAEFGMKP